MRQWWLSDFALNGGYVYVRETGHRVRLDRRLRNDAAIWLGFYASVEFLRTRASYEKATIAFLPRRARPWYLIWAVAKLGGMQIVDDPRRADIVMHFEDTTLTTGVGYVPLSGQRGVNLGCRDISKSAVARAFFRAAGYRLEVDPTRHVGPMVAKSEMNAAHDGRVVIGPLEAREAGQTYQRLIDNRIAGGRVEDLRTVTVAGRPVVVFRKRRLEVRRFANENVEVELARPGEVFSAEEMALISRFARELRFDWGGLDILRDREDGRIYIVDANKTDMGPPLALPLKDKLTAVRIIADAFLRAFGPRAAISPAHRTHSNTAFQPGPETRKGALPAPERAPVQTMGGQRG